MVMIAYVDQDGTTTHVDVAEGVNLMEAAVRGGVATIEGECGGALACATCHIYVPDEWRAQVGEPSADEQVMLEFGQDVDARSRLACQIIATPAMEGMTVYTPRSQR